LGAFAPVAAIFHLYTHAFFKALLFLGAGSVMHALGGVIDLREFGGLRRLMPVTWVTFVAGGLALAGFPLTAGFFSKDAIIHAGWELSPVFGVVGLVTAALTALYTFRMIFWAFWGPARAPAGAHVRESDGWMTVPLVLLAVGAVFAGYWRFGEFLLPAVQATEVGEGLSAHGGSAHGVMIASIVAALGGIGAAWVLYRAKPGLVQALVRRAGRAYELLANKYYMDELYDEAFVRPVRGLGRGMFGCDNYVIDGLLWVITAIPRGMAFVLRELQRGAVQGYALGMVVAVAIVVIALLVGS
jgi:NADH-quinone oxidoreductase subunit L